jgi:hypothetical protein
MRGISGTAAALDALRQSVGSQQPPQAGTREAMQERIRSMGPVDVEMGLGADDGSSCGSEAEHVDFMGGFTTNSTYDPKKDV